MGIELVFLAVALVCVFITRGSYKKLFSTRFSHLWTLPLVVVGQVVVAIAPFKESQYDTIGLGILLATYVLLFGFCCANLNLKGMWIVLTGIACNAAVIGLNKGMPVTDAGGYEVRESVVHQRATSNDLLPWLSDIIPLNRLSVAISVGDIILGLGLIVLCVRASRRDHDVRSSDEIIDLVSTDNEEISDENKELISADISASSDELRDVEYIGGIAIAKEDDDVLIDISHASSSDESDRSNDNHSGVKAQEEPARVPLDEGIERAMTTSARGPRSRKSDPARAEKAAHARERRRARKWKKTHGLLALPSKEELGFDEDSMEIVDVAE